MHYYKINNEIMQYCIVSNDIALVMHYRALLKRSDLQQLLQTIIFKTYILKGNGAKLNALQEHDTILR